MEIKGKKAVVFGGASGMANATAKMLKEKGADVAIVDLNAELGAAAAKELGGPFYELNVMDEEAVDATFAALKQDMGALHIMVNTTGTGNARRTLSKEGPFPLKDFRFLIELNLVATFNLTRLSAELMSHNEPEDDERGVIINTASIAAFEGQIGQVAYTASKAAIAGMCLTIARDLGGLGIRCLAIAPSLFATGLTAGIPQEFADVLTKDAAFPKRLGRPEEYSKLALAMIDNPMLNGQCIRLDAGQHFAPR